MARLAVGGQLIAIADWTSDSTLLCVVLARLSSSENALTATCEPPFCGAQATCTITELPVFPANVAYPPPGGTQTLKPCF